MSKVSSYRFEDKAQLIMDRLTERYGISEKSIIEVALDHLWDEYQTKDKGKNVVTVDFEENLEGVNNNLVNLLIEEIDEYTHFKLNCWDNGDKVQFYLEED